MTKFKIYQINLNRDTNAVCFEPLLQMVSIEGAVNRKLYDKVWEDERQIGSIEDLFQIFNYEIPEGYYGRSMSVSDVIEIEKSDVLDKGLYYCDSIGFKKIFW